MDLFSGLKSFFKTEVTTIDNHVFRMHYKGTAVMLVAFSMLVTGRQYIGDPIDCTPIEKLPEKLLDTFCWIHTTFSVPSGWEKKVGEEVPYPGVMNAPEGEKRVYHAYYQWVCFVLFLQAILFYTPRYFWKAMEGGKIKNLILGLNSPILTEEKKIENRKLLVEYLVNNRNNHKFYFTSYAIAEIMNFVNVVGQMYLTDALLGGEFSSYGLQVIKFTEWDWDVRYDPMMKVFPRVTKCIYRQFGSGGTVEKKDTICVLPINIINEKIYVFLWFWFVILGFVSAVIIVYRAVIIFYPASRVVVTRSRGRLANPKYLDCIIRRCHLGDWFLLDLLSKNLDSLNFRDLINDLAGKFDVKAVDV